jgi:small conductance mechanosensitive channel
MAFLTALGQLSIELGPLIAGASIAGVAISFGAQNLVRDFLSGLFVLLEDQYGVGDMIETEAATGRVEAVSLRSTQLRDLHGTLWHIPNGEMKKVGNFSQGWSQGVLDVEVGEDADLDATKRTIEKAARELMDDPDLGPRIMDEPQVWGVERIGDGVVALRLAVRTSPRARWRVERELRVRVKRALEKRNVPLKAVS